MNIVSFNTRASHWSFKALATLLLISFSSLIVYSNETGVINLKESNENLQKDTQSEHWAFLTEYSAVYEVYYNKGLVGTATETLSVDNGLWKLVMDARLKKLFFKVHSTEFSEFAIENQILLTQRFYSKTEMTFKKDKIIEQVFDWTNKVETGLYKKRSWRLPLEQQIFDRMSHTIQLRHELINQEKSAGNNICDNMRLQFLISHKGKHESYLYKSLGMKSLSTAYGEFDAIKLERTKKNGDKFLIWLSPKLNYFPIKISQKEKGKSDVSFLLKNVIHSKMSGAFKITNKP